MLGSSHFHVTGRQHNFEVRCPGTSSKPGLAPGVPALRSAPVDPTSASRGAHAEFEALLFHSPQTEAPATTQTLSQHRKLGGHDLAFCAITAEPKQNTRHRAPPLRGGDRAVRRGSREKYLLFSRLSVRGHCGPFPFSVHCNSRGITHLSDNQGREHSRPWQRQATCQTI